MIEFIFFALFIFIFFVLVYRNIRVSMKLASAKAEVLRLSIDNTILSEKLLETFNNKESKTEDSSSAFLKFISDSRDWAYNYIEDVQSKLSDFITEVEPDILYFDTYGDLMSAEPNYNSMKKISSSFKELKKLLPEDYGKIV